MKSNQSGFGVVEGLLILIIVGILGFTGWYVWHSKNNANENLNAAANTNLSTSSTKKKSTTTTGSNTSLKTGVLTYEKASFKYPGSWTIVSSSKTNGSVSPGTDNVTLTSPTTLQVTIGTGIYGIGSAPGLKLLSATPINTFGHSYFLSYQYDSFGNDMLTAGPCISTKNADGFWLPESKNITVVGDSTTKPVNNICIGYPRVNGDTTVRKTVAEFKADASYSAAVSIIESITY